MARKQSTGEEKTPALQKFREKRKWQIALRRYTLEESPCPAYAPYFGLDIKNMRNWFEYQFREGISWANFGEKWQFDHIIPVTCFDFSNDEELKICWNFTNLRVGYIQPGGDNGTRMDLLAAKKFFKELWNKTQYSPCQKLLHKIDQLESAESASPRAQEAFIRDHRQYLDQIESFSHLEFELLNNGRSIEEVNKETQFLKNFEK